MKNLKNMFWRFVASMGVGSLIVFSFSAVACTSDGKEGIAPENNLYIPVGKAKGGITEEQFNAVIDKVSSFYTPIIKSMGAEFVVDRSWTDGTVNAYASRPSENIWKVRMFGGLARHETVTIDGFALVLCHEIGHHLGGAPKYYGDDWASNEGQADYFGTLKCFRRVFEQEDNQLAVQNTAIPEAAKLACQKSWPQEKDYFLCLRSAMAGDSLAKLLAALGRSGPVNFNTPDQHVVEQTADGHPAAQCRLDTYFNGALCGVDFNTDVSNDDEVVGTCHQSTDTVGVRPLCWFKPKV